MFNICDRKRRIVFGWSNDENESIRNSQGWGGVLTLPREHFVVNYHRILNYRRIKKPEPFSVVSVQRVNGYRIHTLRTMGVRPIHELLQLRQHWFKPTELLSSLGRTHRLQDTGYSGIHYEIRAQFRFPRDQNAGRYGFSLRASPDGQEQTGVYYDLSRKQIVVDKTRASSNATIDSTSEIGHFELFQILNSAGDMEMETLDLRIFVDNSIIEVYFVTSMCLLTNLGICKRPIRAYGSHLSLTG